MRILSHIMLVGAVVLLGHLEGCDSYALNVVDADDSLESTTTDSLEITTDSHHLLDSREHINQTSTEDNSLEANKRVRRNVQQPAAAIVDRDYDDRDSIETTTVDNVSLEDILAGLNGQPQTLTELPVQATTPDVDDDLVNSVEKIQTDDLADASLETNGGVQVAVAPPSQSILSHLPVIGVYSHPASDDLYLVKQYLGDYYFWEMGDDDARNYFSRAVKDTTTFEFDTPVKVDAAQFAQFTPVRALPAAFHRL